MILDYITIMIKSESDSINTVKKQVLLNFPLILKVAGYVTHLYTLVCDSSDVTQTIFSNISITRFLVFTFI